MTSWKFIFERKMTLKNIGHPLFKKIKIRPRLKLPCLLVVVGKGPIWGFSKFQNCKTLKISLFSGKARKRRGSEGGGRGEERERNPRECCVTVYTRRKNGALRLLLIIWTLIQSLPRSEGLKKASFYELDHYDYFCCWKDMHYIKQVSQIGTIS